MEASLAIAGAVHHVQYEETCFAGVSYDGPDSSGILTVLAVIIFLLLFLVTAKIILSAVDLLPTVVFQNHLPLHPLVVILVFYLFLLLICLLKKVAFLVSLYRNQMLSIMTLVHRFIILILASNLSIYNSLLLF